MERGKKPTPKSGSNECLGNCNCKTKNFSPWSSAMAAQRVMRASLLLRAEYVPTKEYKNSRKEVTAQRDLVSTQNIMEYFRT